MSKEQIASLPDPSTNLYDTVVVPVAKNCPDRWDLEANVTTPELSVAVGYGQVMILPPDPRGVVSLKLSMQFWITGGTLSTEKSSHVYKIVNMLTFSNVALQLDYTIIAMCMYITNRPWSLMITFKNSNVKRADCFVARSINKSVGDGGRAGSKILSWTMRSRNQRNYARVVSCCRWCPGHDSSARAERCGLAQTVRAILNDWWDGVNWNEK